MWVHAHLKIVTFCFQTCTALFTVNSSISWISYFLTPDWHWLFFFFFFLQMMWHLMFWKDISLMYNSLLPACLHATSVCACVCSGEHLSRFVYICVCGRETESEQISMQMKSEQWHCLFCYCHWNINWKKCSAQNSRLLCLHSDCWSAQKCRHVIDISLFWIRPKEGQADVIYCSLSISFLWDMNTLIQMSTITFSCHLTKKCCFTP